MMASQVVELRKLVDDRCGGSKVSAATKVR